MELFVFVRMGGKESDMVVKLLNEKEDLVTGLAKFDAAKAKCFLERDRQRLMAVIEAPFGTFGAFNQIVRRYFKEQLTKPRSASLGLQEVKILEPVAVAVPVNKAK